MAKGRGGKGHRELWGACGRGDKRQIYTGPWDVCRERDPESGKRRSGWDAQGSVFFTHLEEGKGRVVL